MAGVSTTNSSSVADANGITTVFNFTFFVYSVDDIKVYSVLNDVPTPITTGITKSINSSFIGGSVTFDVAPADAVGEILIRREVSYTQGTELADLTRFKETAIEQALNTIVLQVQQLAAQVSSSLKFAETAGLSNVIFPDPEGAAGKFPRVNSDEDGFDYFELVSSGDLLVSDYIETLLDDASASEARTTLGLGTAAVENIATINANAASAISAALLQAIPKRYISGLYATAINYSSSTVASFTLVDGACTNHDDSVLLKATGLTWNITNGNAANGYQGGTTLPNSSTIHFYVIALAADTSWTATFASTSLTPTLPGSYTKYRRVFSLRTNGSGVLLAGVWNELGGGALSYRLTTPVLDVNDTNPDETALVTKTLPTVPTGLVLTARLNVAMNSGNSTGALIFQPLTQADAAPSISAAPGFTLNIGATGQVVAAPDLAITTNTSAQVAYRTNNNGTTAVVMATVLGWEDARI